MINTTTKRLNLAQLTEWAWKHNITDLRLYSNKGSLVKFDHEGRIYLVTHVDHDEIFTVKSEDLYDLDTVIPLLLAETSSGIYREYRNTSINDLPFFKSHFEQYSNIYIINADNTHTLLWQFGKLVE